MTARLYDLEIKRGKRIARYLPPPPWLTVAIVERGDTIDEALSEAEDLERDARGEGCNGG